MELINIKDVNVRYKNGVNAIHNLSVKIKKGDFVGFKKGLIKIMEEREYAK